MTENIVTRPGTKFVCSVDVPPGKELLPFQIESQLLLVARKHNLLADEMGLGKTIQAIVLINSLKMRRVLIVCKASIKRNWQHKLEEWLTSRRVIQIIDKKTDFISDFAEVVIVNYDLITHSYIHQQLTETKWDLLICDEAHYLKNLDAKRTKAVLDKTGLVRCANRTLMMTGTPVLNRPKELYPILRVLAPMVIAPYSDKLRYGRRYCAGFQDGFGFNWDGASHTEELNQKLRQHYMIRRMTNEVQVQLPSKRYEVVFIDSSDGVRKNLRILSEAGRKDFKHQNLGVDGGNLARIRREIAENKLAASLDLIRGYVESCGKLVIFAYHHSIIDRLEKELRGYGVVSITGSNDQRSRENSLNCFKNSESIKVFIGQIQAAGEGIDGLQNSCSNVLFVETSWVPGEIEQAVKRIHRMGQTKPVLIRFLVWADSVEEHMMRVALDKVKVIKEITK